MRSHLKPLSLCKHKPEDFKWKYKARSSPPLKKDTPLPKIYGHLFSISHRIHSKESHYGGLVDLKQGINLWGDLK